jgi:hypothetical protein
MNAPRPAGSVLTLLLWTATACGGRNVGAEQAEPIARLQIGRTGELNGTRYVLDARFAVSGPEQVTLDTRSTTAHELDYDLTPGAYTITVQSDFHVLEDVAVAEVPIASALVSARTQGFQLASGTTTTIDYRFDVEGGTVSLDGS